MQLDNLGLKEDHYAYQMVDGMTNSVPSERWKLKRIIDDLANETLHSTNSKADFTRIR